MSMNDPIASALSLIMNAEKVGRRECLLKPRSRLLKQLLTLLQHHNYVQDIAEVADGKGGYLKVKLSGTINKCGVIKPRFSVSIQDYEKFERRYLPAKDFGILIVSTSKGIMAHTEAKAQHLGGRLLVYCY